MTAPSWEEAEVANLLRAKIRKYARKNEKKYALYDGEFTAKQIGIAVPPSLRDWPVKLGWGTTVVDVVAERMNWLNYEAPGGDLLGLDEFAERSDMVTVLDEVVESYLTVGTTFTVVDMVDGEPTVVHRSPSTMAMDIDAATGVPNAALHQVRTETGAVAAETLYLRDETVTWEVVSGHKNVVIDRDRHNLGRLPVTQWKNQPNDKHPNGRSLLTAPIEYYISAAIRTMLAMEVHREFFSAPQRDALNVDPEVAGFRDDMTPEERWALGWRITMGRMNFIPPNEEGMPEPKLHEYRPSPPTSYIEILRYLSLMVASDAGLPASYFGNLTDNPSSSESIKALESRIERRALTRMAGLQRPSRDVGRLVIMRRGDTVDEAKLAKVRSKWQPPATPTPSAAADYGLKLIAGAVLPPDSKVTYDRVGLTPAEQLQLEQDKRRSLSTVMEALARGQQNNGGGVSQRAQHLASRRVDRTE